MSCSLDGYGKLSLVAGTSAGHSARKNLCTLRKALSDAYGVFVIDVVDLIGTVQANLFSSLITEGNSCIIALFAGLSVFSYLGLFSGCSVRFVNNNLFVIHFFLLRK